MRVISTIACVLLLAISLCAQDTPPQPGGKSNGVVFQEIKFVGVRQVPLAALRKIAAHYEGKLLDDSRLSELAERIRDVYQQYGFFKVQITRDETVTGNSKERPLPITYQVEEGRRYRLKSITFKSGKAFRANALRPLFPIRAGEIFDTSKIRVGLENLREAYGKLGYINFTPVPDTTVDEGDGTVLLVIDLDEGKPFRIGSLKIFGLDWNRTTRLLCGWPLKPGAIYNNEIVERYFSQNRYWLPSGAVPQRNVEVRRDEKKATVDVFLNFSDVEAPKVEVDAHSPKIVFSVESPPRK